MAARHPQAHAAWLAWQGAEANYGALLKFFDSFPEYKDNEFFITGESCAHEPPSLAPHRRT